MRKLIFAMVLALVMCFSLVGVTSAQEETTQAKQKEQTNQEAPKQADEDKEEGDVCKGKKVELPANASSVAVEATQKDGCVIQNGIGVALPEPNGGAAISLMQEDGSEAELFVTRSSDGGTVEVEEEPQPEPPAEAIVPECQDDRFLLRGTKIEGTITWRYNGSTAENISGHGAAVDAATNSIETVNSQCSVPDEVPNIFEEGAATSQRADVLVDSTTGALVCEPSDGQSVVSWGAIRSGTIAAECNYTLGVTTDGFRKTVETDIEGNKSTYNFTTTPGRDPNKFDIQSIMTHERGHSAGLDHAGDPATSQLTMVPTGTRGSTWMRSLGLGDALGLNTLYP